MILCCVEVDHYLKALGRYFLSTFVCLDLTVSNFNTESSVTFRTIFLPLSGSDTPVVLNVYSIPQTRAVVPPVPPVPPSSRISALPYFPVSLSSSLAVVVALSAKHFPFWRLVLMLVFSPSAKVKASDTCARAI